jgi:hypothetical protein
VLINEIIAARNELQTAYENFNNARPEFIDSALTSYNAAREKYDALHREARKVKMKHNLILKRN